MQHDFVLHIGANKTGSSAVQAFIRSNLSVFQDAGYLVPDSNLDTSGRITGEQVFAFQKYIVPNDVAALTATFDRLKAEAGQNTVLCSAENLSNPGRHQTFTEIGQKYSVKVVLYIRRQDDLIASSWQQWHSKVSDDFNAWLITALQSIGHWERTISGWENIVGTGNVSVRIFERESFPEGNIMLDFLECLGIPYQDVPLEFPSGDINPSFSDAMTGLVAGNKSIFKNTDDNEFYQMIQALTGDTYIERKKISLMTAKQRENTVKFFEAQNERIREKYFPSREALFKPLDHAKYRYLSTEEIALEQRKIMMHLIFSLWKQSKA